MLRYGLQTLSRAAVGRSSGNVRAYDRFYASSGTDGKQSVYVVFGATGGIGSCLVRRLVAQPNSAVVVVGREIDRLENLGVGDAMVADAQDAKQVDDVITRVVSKYGRVDGVANCIGSIILKPAHTTSEAEFEQTIRLNLFTSFNILKSSVKAIMPLGGGSIVLCSSAVAKHGIPNHEAVAAAKAGIEGLARSAAATYAPKNIRINCIAPGLTRTPLAARITGNPAALKASEAMHALKRIGEADDVAAGIEFLMDPKNSFITGQVLGIDGGLGSLKPQ